MNRLNLGCGPVLATDWINLDREQFGQTHVVDLRNGLPFTDAYFDYVVANHSLQMLTYDEWPAAVQELYRVLKAGGVLRIIVPSLHRAVDAYERQDASYFPIDNGLENTLSGKFARYLFWHGQTRSAFTASSLRDMLIRNGWKGQFVDCDHHETASRYDGITSLDSREEESLIIEASK